MGIDPVTHMPLSPSTDLQLEQQQQLSSSTVEFSDADENKENRTSTESPIYDGLEEEKSITSELNAIEADALLSKSPAFCTDEVPLIQTHEILAPCASSSPSPSSSNSSLNPEEFRFSSMEWPEILSLGELDDFIRWDSICDEGIREISNWYFQSVSMEIEAFFFLVIELLIWVLNQVPYKENNQETEKSIFIFSNFLFRSIEFFLGCCVFSPLFAKHVVFLWFIAAILQIVIVEKMKEYEGYK